MKKNFILLFLFFCSTTSQASEECVSKLPPSAKYSDLNEILACFNKKIESLESQLEKLNARNSSTGETVAPVPDPTLSPPNTTTQNLKTGSTLDLWLFNGEDLRMVPNEPSLGTMVDKSKPFSFDSFRRDSNLSHYYKNKPTGLMWSGYLNVEEAGNYLILHEFDIKETKAGMGWRYEIYSKFLIDDEVVVENELNIRGDGSGLFPESTSVKLAPGKHKFQLWLAAKWAKHNGYWPNYELEPANINVNIKWRKPGANKTTVITVNDLLHEASEK